MFFFSVAPFDHRGFDANDQEIQASRMFFFLVGEVMVTYRHTVDGRKPQTATWHISNLVNKSAKLRIHRLNHCTYQLVNYPEFFYQQYGDK